jgi:hypothetical protein
MSAEILHFPEWSLDNKYWGKIHSNFMETSKYYFTRKTSEIIALPKLEENLYLRRLLSKHIFLNTGFQSFPPESITIKNVTPQESVDYEYVLGGISEYGTISHNELQEIHNSITPNLHKSYSELLPGNQNPTQIVKGLLWL